MSIIATQIGKTFGKTTALEGVSLTLEPEKIYGLLGRNGLRYKLKKLSSTSLR